MNNSNTSIICSLSISGSAWCSPSKASAFLKKMGPCALFQVLQATSDSELVLMSQNKYESTQEYSWYKVVDITPLRRDGLVSYK